MDADGDLRWSVGSCCRWRWTWFWSGIQDRIKWATTKQEKEDLNEIEEWRWGQRSLQATNLEVKPRLLLRTTDYIRRHLLYFSLILSSRLTQQGAKGASCVPHLTSYSPFFLGIIILSSFLLEKKTTWRRNDGTKTSSDGTWCNCLSGSQETLIPKVCWRESCLQGVEGVRRGARKKCQESNGEKVNER